jgi:flagellar biosynthesis/type III secretory pathway M-ring protein FliF/YscJ
VTALAAVAIAAAAAGTRAQDGALNAVELKTAIERHYAAKVSALLAPCFRQAPAVSVEVDLDLESVQRVVERSGDRERTVETVVRTPGAVRRRSIAVAVPAAEVPVGFGPSTWRPLVERGLAFGPEDRLEIVALPFRPEPAPLVGSDRVERPSALLPVAGHVLWAGVALVLGTLLWSALRRFADREPLPAPELAPAPAPVAAPAPAPAAPVPAPALPAAAARPTPMPDPVTAVRRAAERDPARVADALRGWIRP